MDSPLLEVTEPSLFWYPWLHSKWRKRIHRKSLRRSIGPQAGINKKTPLRVWSELQSLKTTIPGLLSSIRSLQTTQLCCDVVNHKVYAFEPLTEEQRIFWTFLAVLAVLLESRVVKGNFLAPAEMNKHWFLCLRHANEIKSCAWLYKLLCVERYGQSVNSPLHSILSN